MVLAELSPTAAKIYVALNTLASPTDDPRIARIPVTALSKLANLAPRTCAYALRELQNLHLISQLPHRNGSSCAYRIDPFPCTPAKPLHHDAVSPSKNPSTLHHHAAPSTPTLHPRAASTPPTLHQDALSSSITPDSIAKTHNLHHGAVTQPNAATPLEKQLKLIQSLLSHFSPEEKSALLQPYPPRLRQLAQQEDPS